MYVWIVQYQGFVNLSLWCQRGTINWMLEYHDRLISVTYLVESGLYEKCMFTHVNLLGSYCCMCDHGMTTHTSCWPTQWSLVSIYIIIVFPPFCASRKAWATVAPCSHSIHAQTNYVFYIVNNTCNSWILWLIKTAMKYVVNRIAHVFVKRYSLLLNQRLWHLVVNTLFHHNTGQVHLRKWESVNFNWDFTELFSQGSNKQYFSIGSDNDLGPARR